MKTIMGMASMLVLASASAKDCDNPQTQLDMNDCAVMEYQRVDSELNAVYAEYRKRLSPSQAQQLKAAEVAWIKFRDASCIFETSEVEGGSIHPLVYHDCLSTKTRERIAALKALASCKEGDPSCPEPN